MLHHSGAALAMGAVHLATLLCRDAITALARGVENYTGYRPVEASGIPPP